MSHPCNGIQYVFAWSVLIFCAQTADAEPSLHIRIDQLIAETRIVPAAPLASDAEFLRRVSLDLTGSIPSSDAARKFLDDPSPDKRTALVDQLLASRLYVRHMVNVFDVMLTERRAETDVPNDLWKQYLWTSLEQNKPYNQIAAEILGADGGNYGLTGRVTSVEEHHRAMARFYLDRKVEPNLMTRDTARIFFGMDLQCAQCHDHPLIDDYLQSDYYGIYAFLQRSHFFRPDKEKPAVIAEKADGEADFKSVFTGEEGRARPHLPGGATIDDPTIPDDEQWLVKPDEKDTNIRPLPKYSRRAQLARLATDGTNRAFNINIANRLWAHMMGHGLVHPVDLHHRDNPPAHIELLELLAGELVANQFDVKSFLRQIALSEAYQRVCDLPDIQDDPANIQTLLSDVEAHLEQLRETLGESTKEFDQAQSELSAANHQVKQVAENMKKTLENVAAAQETFDQATVAHRETANQLSVKRDATVSLTVAAAKSAEAARELSDDTELAKVAENILMISQRLAVDVENLEQMAPEKANAVKSSSENLANAKHGLDSLTAEDMSARQHRDKQQQEFDRTGKIFHDQSAAAKHNELRIQVINACIQYTELLAEIDLVQKTIDTNKSLDAESKRAQDEKQAIALETAYNQLVEHLTRQGEVAAIEPLTPEQLAWSTIRALGLFENQLAVEETELNKTSPLEPDQKNDPEKLSERAAQIEEAAYKKLEEHVSKFVQLFGPGPAQPQHGFFATPDQALFYQNSDEILEWLTPKEGTLTDRLTKMGEPQTIAEELYLSVFTRKPVDVEVCRVTEYLASRPDEKEAVVQELVWALLTSTEFRFHH